MTDYVDHDLEKAIDEVGRDRVIAKAVALGWGNHGAPPKWVWWQIVAEFRAAPVEQAKTIIDGAQERHEARSKRLFSDPKVKEALHRRPVEQAKTEVEG
jgi:hypothetical protein